MNHFHTPPLINPIIDIVAPMESNTLNQKKILICLDGFRHGGTQHAILLVLPFFCKNFKKVYLIVLQQNSDDLQIPAQPNLEVIKFDSTKLLDVNLVLELSRFFRGTKPNIILASMFRSIVFTTLLKNVNSKVFWMEQNTYTMRTKFHWFVMRILAHKISKIICISEDVAKYTMGKISNSKKIVVIPNPIHTSVIKIENQVRKNDFIFVGRLVMQKNPSLAIESFATFLDTYKLDSCLHIVGDGELMESLKQRSVDLGISKNCVFHGFLPNPEVHKILVSSKTLISTSSIEGLAMVRLEALVNGNCIVTTNSGGTEQFFQIDSDIGVFLANSNYDFAKKMFLSTEDKYWSNSSIVHRRQIGLKFSPEKIFSLFLSEFKS